MRDRWVTRFTFAFVLAAACASPAAAVRLGDLRGQVSVGFGKLFLSDAPGGSLSSAAGLSLPLTPEWSLGAGVGLHLLGSRTVERGSLIASVDYSLFDAGLFVHWRPQHLGPIGRIMFGPEVMSARAELSTAGGGAAFSDLAVEKVAAGAGIDVTIMPRREAPVLIGLELGARYAFLPGDDWTIGTARVAFHY